jgi:hypothetical protein
MPDADYNIDDILQVFAKGAPRADFAAHAEAAEMFRDLAQAVGPELASLYARDWRLQQRTVKMQVDAHVSKSSTGGLLRIFVKGTQTEITGHTVEVVDQYAATDAAPLTLDEMPAPPGLPTPGPTTGTPVSDEVRDEVQRLLLTNFATDRERERAADHCLAPGDRFHIEWRMLLRAVLIRLKWPEQRPPDMPSLEVRDFLKAHVS